MKIQIEIGKSTNEWIYYSVSLLSSWPRAPTGVKIATGEVKLGKNVFETGCQKQFWWEKYGSIWLSKTKI